MRMRRQSERSLTLRTVELERDQDERARAAVVEERARIARELHDVVAHAISVVVVQSRGGRKVLDRDPEAARSAFDSIERTGEQALGEMRRLLGMLRETTTESGHGRRSRRSSGSRRSPRRCVPRGFRSSSRSRAPRTGFRPGSTSPGYRIVQEALTNVLKHAGPAVAHVGVRFSSDAVEIDVVDDGRGGLDGARHRQRPARDQGAGRRGRRRGRGRPAGRRRIRRPRPPAVRGRTVIRVLIADDQSLVRTGFRLILSGEPGIEVVGEARDGAEAAALAAELAPDVVLMDVRMPEVDGIEATRRIVVDETSPACSC